MKNSLSQFNSPYLKLPIFLPILMMLALLHFTSCDSSSSNLSAPISGLRIDDDFQEHLDFFLSEAAKRNIDINLERLGTLTIQYDDLDHDTLGLCTTTSITNNITVATSIDQPDIKWVVIHELGHCLLRMDHRDQRISIMNSFLNSDDYRAANEEQLLDEFFTERYFEAY